MCAQKMLNFQLAEPVMQWSISLVRVTLSRQECKGVMGKKLFLMFAQKMLNFNLAEPVMWWSISLVRMT